MRWLCPFVTALAFSLVGTECALLSLGAPIPSGAGVILSVMGGGVFTNVLAAPNAWPTEVLAPLFVCAGTEWLVPKSPVAFHSLGLLPQPVWG